MKVNEIITEAFKNTYDPGDNVDTALGTGKITKTVDDGHVMFHPDADSQKKYKLEDRPYRMGYGEIHKHI